MINDNDLEKGSFILLELGKSKYVLGGGGARAVRRAVGSGSEGSGAHLRQLEVDEQIVF